MIPALAVARELQQRGQDVLFIGTSRGLEAKLVPAAGFPLEYIEIGGLKNVGLLRKVRSLWQLVRSTAAVGFSSASAVRALCSAWAVMSLVPW